MADTKAKTAAPKAAAPKDAATAKKGEKKRVSRPRNYDLGNGVYRYSRSRMYHKKAIYKFVGKKTPKKVNQPVLIYKKSNILINRSVEYCLNNDHLSFRKFPRNL